MEPEKIDPQFQLKLGLQAFFDSNGYKLFRNELDELCIGAQDKIIALHKSSVNLDKLSDLNFALGGRAALQKVLFVLEDLEDKLKERNSSSDVKAEVKE